MAEGPYDLVRTPEGITARIRVRGHSVLSSPTINRGTAFTAEERRKLGLVGLLPTGVTTLDGQLRRSYGQYSRQSTNLGKWVYLANLRDRNEVLFYRLLADIAIGKLAVYIVAAGLHPRRVIPVVLDMGTDNLRLPNDEMYIGNRHARIRDQRYDDLVDAYVTSRGILTDDSAALRDFQRPYAPSGGPGATW